MSDENWTGSIGTDTHLRLGQGSDSVILESFGGQLATRAPGGSTRNIVGQPIQRVSASAAAISPGSSAYATGTNIGHESRQRHRSAVAGRDIQLVFAAVYAIGEASQPAGVNRTVRASIEYPSGTFYPAYGIDGQRDATYGPGGIAKLYVRGVDIPANTDYFVRCQTVGLSSDAVTAWMVADGTQEYGTQFSVSQDHTLTATGQPAFNANPMFAPSAITILPYARSVCVAACCDSIGMGTGETGGSSVIGPGGWLNRALSTDGSGRYSPAIPLILTGILGETAANYANNVKRQRRFAMIDECFPTYAFTSIGSNDFGSGTAALEANATLIWQALANRGAQVFANTLPPNGTSSDSFATLVNQTVNGAEANRVAYNTWIRAGAPLDPTAKTPVAVGTAGALVAGRTGHPLCSIVMPNGGAGYVDLAQALESSFNSGKWAVDGTAFKYTTDGTHPSTFGHQACAANVNKALLV